MTASKAKIKLISSNKIHIIHKADILYLSADSNYCKVVLKSGKKILCSQTLKSVQEKLKSPHFFRCHQSYVFNMNYLESVCSTMSELHLIDGTIVPISRSNRAELKSLLKIWFD
ncbi:LytR/AlgR family response regulator transcription factor [Portibacter lacus]